VLNISGAETSLQDAVNKYSMPESIITLNIALGYWTETLQAIMSCDHALVVPAAYSNAQGQNIALFALAKLSLDPSAGVYISGLSTNSFTFLFILSQFSPTPPKSATSLLTTQ
jgi:hypothetical protein